MPAWSLAGLTRERTSSRAADPGLCRRDRAAASDPKETGDVEEPPARASAFREGSRRGGTLRTGIGSPKFHTHVADRRYSYEGTLTKVR
ncbi:hypothetical protein BRAS3809_1670010 [Bradyrhizobium sp. STM 3809]|nr:hypothetical protein BRAS3809_1670010 [Bradyrhizobium sp. STM 3809]